jgi:hypothetical protein
MLNYAQEMFVYRERGCLEGQVVASKLCCEMTL